MEKFGEALGLSTPWAGCEAFVSDVSALFCSQGETVKSQAVWGTGMRGSVV